MPNPCVASGPVNDLCGPIGNHDNIVIRFVFELKYLNFRSYNVV